MCFVAVSLVVVGCSSSTPATTPTSLPTTSTTTLATTTTVDRITEIEAIFRDLEERRMEALYTGDREAFREAYIDNNYLKQSLSLFELVVFLVSPRNVQLAVVEVLHEDGGCIAAEVATDYTGITEGGGQATGIVVLERSGDGWGISYSGKGWTCDGPHPLG